MLTTNGNRHTCHLQAAQARRSLARSLHIALLDRKARSRCADQQDESELEGGHWRHPLLHSQICPINAPFVRNVSRPSTIGKGTRSRFIYPSRSGCARFTELVLLSQEVKSFAASFVDWQHLPMLILKDITTLCARTENWMSGLFIAKTISFSTYDLFTMPSMRAGL